MAAPRRFRMTGRSVPRSMDIALSIPKPKPSAGGAADCVPQIDGLYWVTPSPLLESWSKGLPFNVSETYSDSTNELVTNQTLVYPDYVGDPDDDQAMGVGVHAVQLRGVLCDCEVFWTVDFEFTEEPEDLADIYTPTFFFLNNTLIMVVRDQAFDGIATISASSCGVTYGPVSMTFQSIAPE